MTITTITRSNTYLVRTGVDFNTVLDTGNPCDELAELQEQYDAAVAMDPPAKGAAGLASRIKAKQRECDAYNAAAAPAPVSKPTSTEAAPARKAEDTQQKQEQDENKAARGEYLHWKNGGND